MYCSRTLTTILLASSLTISACGESTEPMWPGPGTAPPRVQPVVIGLWQARDLAGVPLPASIERFANDPAVPGVTEYRLDAADVELTADGRYTRTTGYSEWNTLTPDDESSWRVRVRFRFRDFGTWTRTGDSLVFESGFYQNLTVHGGLSAGTSPLRLNQALTPGDTVLNVGYARLP